ncbi:MAG: response regulator transcription factor [Parvibaculum sp.]
MKGVAEAGRVTEARSVEHLSEMLSDNSHADLVVFDTSANLAQEMETVARLQEMKGIGSVMVIHEQDQPEIARRYLDMGVNGVVPKRTEIPVLVNAARLVLSGGRYVPDLVLNAETTGFAETPEEFADAGLERLTRRQMDVLKELGQGASNQEIGTRLGIALATVKLHVNAILSTLGVRNRTEAAIIAYRAGLTTVDRP